MSMNNVRFGTVLPETLRVYRRQLGILWGVAALISLPQYIVEVLLGQGSVGTVLDLVIGAVSDAWLGATIVLLVWPMLQVKSSNHSPLVESLIHPARRIVSISILVAGTQIAVGTALAFLIVPGVGLFTIWFAALPALVVEGEGVFGAWRRSEELTKGYRKYLVWVALFVLAIQLSMALFALLLGPLGLAGTLFSFGSDVVVYPFSVVAMTIVYAALVEHPEGSQPDLSA